MNFASKVISEELNVFESKFKASVKSSVPLLDRIMQYIVKRKGKQLRPMFVLLSAKLSGGITDATYRAASLVELVHTASLVHDDVVDESYERRGFFSTYALWKSKVSVLVGDYLLSKGLLLSLDGGDYRILQILSDAVRKMSEGELLQIEKARGLNLDESIYFEIIRAKTASLLASACAVGAWSGSENQEITEKLRQFGEWTGIAFQIKDDLFDYGTDAIGKPTGNDIKEKKLTLPLIYTLNNINAAKRRELIYILKNQNRIKERVNYVIAQVRQAGGIQYGIGKMNEYREKALTLLREFPPSETRMALEELVNYTTDRKH
ncbi:MAG: polyprenyl synthetase family protein [Sphingobacteriales bacterium]|nr:polyprenyl synthetase family protein [Sphingobacteriales bacterium]OJY89618.1 MAG: polyprenyl synthetase [Sphingobacteriales bacterium 44-15]